MKITAVIMAGGKGERFWPKSRQYLPKQFLSLSGDGKSMLRHTAERIGDIVSFDDMFIVTNKDYKHIVMEHLPEIPAENIILEPVGRNTAPCVAVAAAVAHKKHGDTVMLVLPSDHVISDVDSFIEILKSAADKAANENCLVTLGITPAYPEIGYGYINFDASVSEGKCRRVKKFVEKPSLVVAEQYLSEGTYLWNSGMFIWRTSVILEKFKSLMPEVYCITEKIQNAYMTADFERVLDEEFPKMPSESVDYGIMEKSVNIYTIPSDFGWDDVGSWSAVERINQRDDNGNVIEGECVALKTVNSTIIGGKKLIAAIGLEDIIVVDTDDAILICKKNNAQDVKSIISQLKKENKTKYL